MAINTNIYNTYQNPYTETALREKETASRKTENKDKTQEVGGGNGVKISKKAQDLLKRLRKTYGNMDFMVADFKNGDEAKEIMSRGNKEFSVLFSPDELEKMAADEKYEKENLRRIEGAVRMAKKINEQFGLNSEFGKDPKNGGLSRFGITFDKDGVMSLFAELEKTVDKKTVKKATVQASGVEELMEKLKAVDWEKIQEEKNNGNSKFDFKV